MHLLIFEQTDVRCEAWDVRYARCMWDVRCEMWDVRCEMWDVRCEMWDVRCEMWDVRCEMWDVRCEMWDVRCEMCVKELLIKETQTTCWSSI